jgi:hypothetical protein
MRSLPAIALSLNRIAFGAGFVVSPSSARSWIGPRMAAKPQSHVLTRALGARDIALGLGALFALGKGERRQARSWMLGHLVADGTDLEATIAERRHLPERAFAFASTVAGVSTAVAAWSAISLGRAKHDAGGEDPEGLSA